MKLNDTQPIKPLSQENDMVFGLGGERPVIVDTPARLVTKLETTAGFPDVRKFDVGAINDAIDRHMKALPEGKTVAAIAHVDMTGAQVAIVGKLPDSIPGETSWTVYATKPWDGDWEAGAALRWSV